MVNTKLYTKCVELIIKYYKSTLQPILIQGVIIIPTTNNFISQNTIKLRKKEEVMDERTADTSSLQYLLTR